MGKIIWKRILPLICSFWVKNENQVRYGGTTCGFRVGKHLKSAFKVKHCPWSLRIFDCHMSSEQREGLCQIRGIAICGQIYLIYHISDTTDKAMIRAQYTIYIFTQYTKAMCDMRSTQYEIYLQTAWRTIDEQKATQYYWVNSKYPTKDVQYRICSKVAGITLASPCPIHILSAFLWRGKSARKSLSRMLQEIFDNIILN